MSLFTHSIHVFLGLPFPAPPTTTNFLQLETQSSASLLSTCPNHLSRPRLTTSSTPSIPSSSLSSSLGLQSFRVTPDIHLTILFSFSQAFAYHSPSSAKFRFHMQAPSVHTLYISFHSLSMKLPSLSTTFSNP